MVYHDQIDWKMEKFHQIILLIDLNCSSNLKYRTDNIGYYISTVDTTAVIWTRLNLRISYLRQQKIDTP